MNRGLQAIRVALFASLIVAASAVTACGGSGPEASPSSSPAPSAKPTPSSSPVPTANAATPSQDVQKYCNTLYQFLDDAQWMSVGVATMALGGGEAAWQTDARSSLAFLLDYGPPLKPLVPKDLRDDIQTVVDAAIESGKLIVKDATASDVVDVWDSPKITEAIKALDNSRMHDEPCASTDPLRL